MKIKGIIIKIILLGLLVPGILMTQQACWDQREVERLGIIMATGVDIAPGGKVRIIVQNVNPAAMGKGATGGGGGGFLGAGKPYRNLSIEGDTIFEAIRQLSRESPRQLFFAHNQVIILSEELARERGVKEVMDFFERNPQMRRTTWLLVSKDKVSELLDTAGRLEAAPSQRIFSIINERDRTSAYAIRMVGNFLELMESESTQPFTAVIEDVPNPARPSDPRHNIISEGQTPEPHENLIINGTAVFRRDKMVGWLNDKESRGLLWVRGEVKGGIIEIPARKGEKLSVSLEILRSKTKLEPEIRDGQIYIKVSVQEESNLGETMEMLDLTKPEVIKKLETLQSEAIRNEIESALVKAQQDYRVDVFGFGEAVHRKYPREWKEMKKMWSELFPGVQVQVQVEAKIRRTGLVSKPVEPMQR